MKTIVCHLTFITKVVFFLAYLYAAGQDRYGPITIKGYVVDTDCNPLSNVEVRIPDYQTEGEEYTDKTGYFKISINREQGQVAINVQKDRGSEGGGQKIVGVSKFFSQPSIPIDCNAEKNQASQQSPFTNTTVFLMPALLNESIYIVIKLAPQNLEMVNSAPNPAMLENASQAGLFSISTIEYAIKLLTKQFPVTYEQFFQLKNDFPDLKEYRDNGMYLYCTGTTKKIEDANRSLKEVNDLKLPYVNGAKIIAIEKYSSDTFFRIQIKAATQSMSDSEFAAMKEKIPYPVIFHIEPSGSKYKFKYLLFPKYSNRQDAMKIVSELKQKGFKDAFIVPYSLKEERALLASQYK